MAKVVVEGTVSRINSRGNGFGLREEESFNGSTKTRYWSVFPPKDAARDVVEGQVVKLEGFLGTRVSERDARYVDHTLNGARVVKPDTSQSGSGSVSTAGSETSSWNAPPVVAADDSWGGRAEYGSEAPF